MRSRLVHALVAVVTWVALLLQLVLVVRGHAVLDQADPPGLGARLVRYASYFTILSNLLVAVVSTRLALGGGLGDLGDRGWRVARLAGLVGIAVTGVVHLVLLRGLLDLDGADLLADTLLHRVVPPLAVLVWVVVGPRGRIDRRDVAWSLLFPVLYVAWTLVHGLATGFWPYPFTDVDELGLARTSLNALAVLVSYALVGAAACWVDRRLPTAREP